MKISYFSGKHPNFGDALNPWMWPRLLPGFFDDDDSVIFLGIGSIIGEKSYNDNVQKIVFGPGFVPEYHDKPKIKNNDWKVYFVRGPRTAKFLDLSEDYALGDPAILMSTLIDVSSRTSEIISYMPHWESIERGNWKEVCKLAGVTFIDPRDNIEHITTQLLRSKLVITEAMHGAIVADAFRIPWVPILPLNTVHRNKWFDWAESLNIDLRPRHISPSSLAEARLSFMRKPINALPFTNIIERSLVHAAAYNLKRLTKASPCLSDEKILNNVISKMLKKLEQLKQDYGKTQKYRSVIPSIKARKVSVIIAAYNAQLSIARALKSALSEPEVVDVILVDDASVDDTIAQAQIADDFSGRLKIIRLSQNSGPSTARNHALKVCTGDWIAVLDADDFFLPGRTGRLLNFTGDADIIADDLWCSKENTMDQPYQLLLGYDLSKPRIITFDDFVNGNITKRNRGELGFVKPIIRQTFLKKNGLEYKEQLHLGEDYEFYAHSLALGAKMILVPAQGYVAVIRSSSLSGQHSEEDLRQLRDCDKQLALLPSLSSDNKKALHQHYLSIDCRLQWRLLILAFKEGNLHKIFATFMRPFPVPLYLLARLLEQLVLRVSKKLISRNV